MTASLRSVLERVRDGALSVDAAARALKAQPFADLGFARVDTHRAVRQGTPEVVYGAGKTADQIVAIVRTLSAAGQIPALVTRLDAAKADALTAAFGADFTYFPVARLGRLGAPAARHGGTVAVAAAGTSDLPVAEEAALTAETFGCAVTRLWDVGVAGLHRLLASVNDLLAADAVVAVAGMEGALPSVVGGLVDSPVIAVPTSVGYGASFGGVTALLAMLNSCAAGVSVVNIDNGFGAGFLAARIARAGRQKQ